MSILLSWSNFSQAQNSLNILNDAGEMFSTSEEAKLLNSIKEAEQENELILKVATIETLNGKSTRDTIGYWADYMNLNEDGLAISALILLVNNERKLDVQFGAALEWEVPEEKVRFIKRDMIEQFKYGNFVKGIQAGIKRIKEYSDYVRWDVDYSDYAKLREVQHLAGNKIVSFPVEAVSKSFKRSKITEEQFSPKYFIYVHSPDDQLVKIRFSKNQLSLVDQLLEAKGAMVFGRVTNTNPLDLNLLGVSFEN
ncbi:MAG: TPM domain-containing protein [Bacteroidota bacterium]